MEVFEQMVYYIRSIQRLDNYLKYQNKKLDWILHFKQTDEKLSLNHPIRKNLKEKELERFSDRCEKVTYGVTHNFLWPYNKSQKNYEYGIVTNSNELLKCKVLKTCFTEDLHELYCKSDDECLKVFNNYMDIMKNQLDKNPSFNYLLNIIHFCDEAILYFSESKPKVADAMTKNAKFLKDQYQDLFQSNIPEDVKGIENLIKNEDVEIEKKLSKGETMSSYFKKVTDLWDEFTEKATNDNIKKLCIERKNDINELDNLIKLADANIFKVIDKLDQEQKEEIIKELTSKYKKYKPTHIISKLKQTYINFLNQQIKVEQKIKEEPSYA